MKHTAPALKRTATALATLAVALSCGLAFASLRAVDARSETLAALEREVAALRDGAKVRASGVAAEAGWTAPLAALDRRVGRLERAPARREVAAGDPAPEREAADASAAEDAPAGEGEEALRPPTAAERAELDTLLAELLDPGFDYAASTDELERFLELARGTSVIEDEIASLERRVEAEPTDLAARMELADAYVAKLFTVPAGPEQGVWGGRAEQQWKEVLARDPRHWDAQFSLANNYSYYPDFLGKTSDAIEGLERAREIQERMPARPEHVHTYLSLARMYARKNLAADARATLEAGLRFHPESAALLEAWEENR